MQCHEVINDLDYNIVASENVNTESLSELGKVLVLWRVFIMSISGTL